MAKMNNRALAMICAVQITVGNLLNRVKQRDESGQTLVEYGVIILLVAIAVYVVVSQFGAAIGKVFTNITGKL